MRYSLSTFVLAFTIWATPVLPSKAQNHIPDASQNGNVATTAIVRKEQARPLTRLVASDAFFAAYVDDVPSLIDRVESSPWSKGIRDPMWGQMKQLFNAELPLLNGNNQQSPSDIGALLLPALTCITGDAVLFVPRSATSSRETLKVANVLQTTTREAMGAIFAARVDGQETHLRELLAEEVQKRGEALLLASERVEGKTIHSLTVRRKSNESGARENQSTFYYTFSEGTFLASGHKAALLSSLARAEQVLAGTAPSNSEAARSAEADDITQNPGYAAMRSRTPDAQAVAFLNWNSIYPYLSAVLSHKGTEEDEAGGGSINLLMPQREQVVKALGLDVVQYAGLAIAVGSSDTRVDTVLSYSEERGLVTLLAFEEGPVARPSWVPSSEWVQVYATNFNYAKAYAALEKIIGEMNPMLLMMAQGYLEQMNSATKVNFKRDVIGSLGTHYISCTLAPKPAAGRVTTMEQADQLMGISLSDAATFERAVLALVKTFARNDRALWNERMLGDIKIRSISHLNGEADEEGETDAAGGGKADARGIHFSIINDWLLVCSGRAATLENALASMNSGPAAKDTGTGFVSFWQTPPVTGMEPLVPQDAMGVSYIDLPRMISLLAATALTTLDNEEGAAVDAKALPSTTDLARFWTYWVSHLRRESDGLHGRLIITHPKSQ